RSTTGDRVEVVPIVVAKCFPRAGCLHREFVESVFVPNEDDPALFQDPAPDVQRQLLEDAQVDVRASGILDPLSPRRQTGRSMPIEQEADIDVRLRSSRGARPAAKENDREPVRIALSAGNQWPQDDVDVRVHAVMIREAPLSYVGLLAQGATGTSR